MGFYAFKQILEEIGISNEDLAHLFNKIYLKHRFEDIELFDDVLPTLNKLLEKCKLILISNGNSYPEKCELDGILNLLFFLKIVELKNLILKFSNLLWNK